MILFDTHASIWMVSAPDQLSESAREAIAAGNEFAISAISCWEFSLLCHKGRIAISLPPSDWMEQSFVAHNIQRLDLTPTIAGRAYELGSDFHGDPADRLIVATALEHGLELVTRDSEIRNCSAAPVCIW